MIKHTVSDADDKILRYQEIFAKLKFDFQDYATLQTQVTVLQIKFISLSMDNKLDDIGKCRNCGYVVVH